MKKLLIANRGEIAVRIAVAASELGIETVAVFSQDDARALHLAKADQAIALRGVGAAAYLDLKQILEVAAHTQCDALHPGIGFLSESAALSQACADAGVCFVGPAADVLTLYADKAAARALAASCHVPILAGTAAATTLAQARDFLGALPQGSGMMMKAVAGGGGRGMQVVRHAADLGPAWERCQAEASTAFGDDALYVEHYLPQARHIEVQLLGDGRAVSHAWTRSCSLQRRHQKLIEIAPAPWISTALQEALLAAALQIGEAAPFCGLATVEFLIDPTERFYFIEVNPRLQVEHTVTEEVSGIDLVQTQLQLAAGATLGQLDLLNPPDTRGFALQARINMERVEPDGQVLAASGTLQTFALPSGPGVRVDTMGYQGYQPSAAFDSLLAKVIVRADHLERTFQRAYRALCETQIIGIDTNLAVLKSLLHHPAVHKGGFDTAFVDEHIAALIADQAHPALHHAPPAHPREDLAPGLADIALSHGESAYVSPMDGTIVLCGVASGDAVVAGQELAVLSAMKMEHVLTAPGHGVVQRVLIELGQVVRAQEPLFVLAQTSHSEDREQNDISIDLDAIRPDLAALQQRIALTQDAARPEAVKKRHERGGRTARENIADLCDPDSFIEYGGLALAAQRGTSDIETLIKRSPADGIITGIGTVNAGLFAASQTRCAVLSYDYTVFAGTQGYQGHRKTDRLLQVAKEARLPVLFFTEGGGGRPNDTDLLNIMISGLECASFREFASLQGLVPLVGINHGRCFAGNAALLGCCDVIIATAGSNIGMGGPAMIEGGGLGLFRPEDIGPIQTQIQSGVVDIAVKDEAEAVKAAQRYLGYFQGPLATWEVPDARVLRHIIPENRLRSYDVRDVIHALADADSVMELRPDYATGMITALARLDGRPFGIIANNPAVLAGAIDTAGAYKASRWMGLCEQFGLPLLFLCDTPGIMVGPDAEASGTVRAAASMFVTAARLTIPFGTIVLRKGYGLGAQAMAGGHFKAPRFLVSWPTGEFGPMGLEGAVRLGFRRQLEAIEDPQERTAMFDQMVAMLYERGKAINIATHFEIDHVIDPADSRQWIRSLMQSVCA